MDRNKLADEVDSAKQTDTWPKFVKDYKGMYDAIKTIRNSKDN